MPNAIANRFRTVKGDWADVMMWARRPGSACAMVTCVSMGACANGGGPFKKGYNVVSGIDKFLPVDMYIPGCSSIPQSLLNGIMQIHAKINGQSLKDVAWYQKEPIHEIPVPILGPDLIDPRQIELIKTISQNNSEILPDDPETQA